MENFYSSSANSWKHNLSTINGIPTSWGMIATNYNIKEWSSNPSGNGYYIRKNGKITIFGVSFDCYQLWYVGPMAQFPTIYIYRNSTHLISNNTSTLLINKPHGSGPIQAGFSPLKSDGYDVCILINGYYYRVETEGFLNYLYASVETKTSPNKTSYQPYERVSLDGISISVYKHYVAYCSETAEYNTYQEKVECANWTEICKKADSYSGIPNVGYYSEKYIGTQSITAVFNTTPIQWDLTVEEFKAVLYSCVEKEDAKYDIYVGKAVDDNFLNSFQITRCRSNEFIILNEIIFNSLDITKMLYTVLAYDDSAFVISHELNNNNEHIVADVTKNLHFLSSTPFKNILIKNKFMLGETIDLLHFDIRSKGSLTYDDNTTIRLSDIEYEEEPFVQCSLMNSNVIEIDDTTPKQFTMSYVLPTRYFGKLQYDFTCFVEGKSDSYINSVSLINQQENFKYGEVISFGDDAQLICYNEKNEIINTIPYSEFSNQLTEVDSRYGLAVNRENGFLTDEKITLLSKMGNKEIRQTVSFSYGEDKLILDTSKVNKLVYFNDNFSDFDYSGLVAKINYHDNIDNIVKEITIDNTSLTFTHEPLDPSIDSKVYTIQVSTTYLNQKIIGNFLIQAERIRPVRIEVKGESDSLHYFDNNLDKFHLPNDLTFTLHWNDGSEAQPIIPETDLAFYRNQNSSEILNPMSIISSSGGNSIYFRHKVYSNLSGFYNIQFVDDKIISLSLLHPVTIILGNTLNSCRDYFVIRAIYQSGLQINDNFTNYRFKNENYLMAKEPVILVCEDKEYTLDETLITFEKPHIKEIVPDFSHFHSSYNNDSDAIDATEVSLNVYYENAKYVQNVNTYNKTKVQSNEFSVSCSELIDYTYNGSEKVHVDMGTDAVEKNIILEFSVFNAFDAADTLNNTLQHKITILEITDIIGISLVKAYQNYHAGDKFLDSFDDTEIMIFYNSVDGIKKKLQIPLNSGFSAINIMPLRNTVFYNTERAKTVRVTAATNVNASLEYTISVNAKYDYAATSSKNLRVVKIPTYELPNGVILENKYLIVEDKYTQVNNGVRSLNVDTSINEIKVFGYLDDIFDTGKNARVIFFEDYIPPIAGESNITIKYPCYVPKNAEYIDCCHFGHLFGNNNAKNRLFLSGNKNLPNCDWHSGAINTSKQEGDSINENGDFTYFEDTSYCFYGQTDNEIIGYDIVSNDKMVVFKSKSDKEPTIYYRTNGLIQAIDGAGNSQIGLNNQKLYEESYPLVTGNIGAGALSNNSITNFNGDTLFLSSDKQLDGLDIVGIIGDNQRYANTRSYYINPLLKAVDLSEAQLFTNNKYLFLILNDCVLVTHFEKYSSNTKQYEWWKLDIKNISAMFEVNDKIYYGTNSGRFYLLENSGYQDIQKIFIGKGGSLLASEGELDNTVTVSKNVIQQLTEEDEYYFKIIPTEADDSSYMYHQVALINNVKSGSTDLYINSEKNALEIVGLSNSKADYEKIAKLKNLLNDKTIYYLNHYENENDISCESMSILGTYYKKYRLETRKNDDINCEEMFYLIDIESGKAVNLRELYRASLCVRLDGEYSIQNINKDNCSFTLADSSGRINLIRYSNQDISKNFKAEIKKYSNVKAYYITAPFTKGNLMYDMTIWGWTLTSDTNIPNSIEVCQATNDVDFDEMVKLVDLQKNDFGHSLDNMNLGNLSFDKFVIPHKYTFYRPLKVPFICFGFRNNDNSNCILGLMQVIYTIPMSSIGRN